MQLLHEPLCIGSIDLHDVAVKAIESESAVHGFRGRLKVLSKGIPHEISCPLGVFVSDDQTGVAPWLVGDQYQRVSPGSRPLTVFSVHVHQEMSQSG